MGAKIMFPGKFFAVLTVFLAAGIQLLRAAYGGTPSPLRIMSPEEGATVSGRISIEVAVEPGTVITNLEIKIDGATIGAQKNPPVVALHDTSDLMNGTHTALAVAQDAAGNIIRSSIVSFVVTNPPRYSFAAGSHVVEDLGVLIASCSQEHQIFFSNTNGDAHLIMNYFGGVHNQLLDVNLTRATSRVFNGTGGRLGVRGMAYRNGVFYYCNPNVYYSGAYRSLFQGYDLATGTTNIIGAITQHGGYNMEWGDDGWLYIGSFAVNNPPWATAGADMVRYHPGTGTLEDLGKVDPVHAAEYGSQYAYYFQADSNFLYVALGIEPWYLGVINTKTLEKSSFFGGTDTLGEVRRSTNGALWYLRRTSDGLTTYYSLTNGIPVQTGYSSANPPPGVVPIQFRAGLVDNAAAYTNDTGFNLDLDLIYPDSSNNVVTVGYERNGSGIWKFVTASNFNLTPANIRRCYPDGTNLFILSFQYGPWLCYRPANGDVFRYGTAPYSMYDALKLGDKWYVSGYMAATLEYDSAQPWTMTKANVNNPSANPRKLPLAMRTHEYFSSIGSDGSLCIAAHVDRGGVGGEIGWYDPVDHSSGSLRAPLSIDHYDVADFKPILGGKKLVYSTLGSALLLFDTTKKALVSTNQPIGAASPGKVVEVGSGIILGLSGTNIYRWDCNTSTLVWRKSLSGRAFGTMAEKERRLELGPDGYVWAFVGNVLNRINPLDGGMTPIYTNSTAQNVMFHGRDLYMYGGTRLYRIKGILKDNRPSTASDLRVVPVGG